VIVWVAGGACMSACMSGWLLEHLHIHPCWRHRLLPVPRCLAVPVFFARGTSVMATTHTTVPTVVCPVLKNVVSVLNPAAT
jgi:hypothetical protein